MKKLFLIGFVSFLFFSIHGQIPNFAWAKGLNSANTIVPRSVAVDPSGNVVSTGYFNVACDFDPSAAAFNITAIGTMDIYISKLDASGNFVWAKNIGISGDQCRGHAITTDASGNIYVTGSFRGSPDFDPGAGSFSLTSAGAEDVFILKLNAAGNFVWAVRMGGATGGDTGYSIQCDASGNIYSTGTFFGTVDFNPGVGVFNLTTGFQDDYVQKLDPSGNFVWATQAGLGNQGFSIFVDPSNNSYVTGETNTGIFVNKYDGSGNLTWSKTLTNSSGAIDGNGVTVDALGNVYYTGWFTSTVDFDPSAAVFNLSSAGSQDAFISKLDASGNFVWANQLGGTSIEQGNSITLDASGNVYSTGYFGSVVDFDPGLAVNNMTATGGFDAYISKLDAGGNFVYALQSSPSTNGEYAWGIFIDAAGSIYSTGEFSGTADFNPGAGTFNLSQGPATSGFIQKLVTCTGPPSQPSSISGLTSLCSGAGAQTYSVSAVAGATSYTWTLPGGWSGTSSSNTLSANTTTASGNVSVTANNACGVSTAQVLSVTVNQAPTSPGPISGSISICESSSQTYSVAPVSGATSYTWSLPGGFSGTSSTNIINVTSGPNSGNVSVSASNSCGTSTLQVLSVQVNNPPGLPSVISGSATLCSGASSQTYSVTFTSSALTYSWTFPGGWTGSSTTNTILATPGTSGTISVLATYSCGTSPTRTLLVTVSPTPTISVNSGSVCSGSSFTMTPSGASTYTFSSGSSVVSPTANASYSVSGTSTAGCVSSSSAVSNVTVFTNPTANAGSSQTITCSFPSVPLNGSGVSTYTWSGPGIVSGGNTASPIVNMAGTYSLVGSTSGCNSNTATVNVLTNTIAPTVTAASNSSLICGPPFQGTATLTATGSAATYSWMPSGSGASISVSPSVTTTFTVIATGSNGCTNMATVTQNVSTCTSIKTFEQALGLVVYPNPTTGKITITYKINWLGFEIYNSLGEKLQLNKVVGKESVEVDLSALPDGIYFVKVGSITRKIIKQ